MYDNIFCVYISIIKKNSESSLFVSLKFVPPSSDQISRLSLLKLFSYVRYYLNLRAFTKNDTYCFILVEKYRFQNLQISKKAKKLRSHFLSFIEAVIGNKLNCVIAGKPETHTHLDFFRPTGLPNVSGTVFPFF